MARTIDKLLQVRRQHQILNAAAECFIKHGFHQTGMKEICKKAGLSAGSVYHYFENKDAIIEGIATEFGSDTSNFFKVLEQDNNFVEGFIKATKNRLKDTQKYIKYGRLVVEIYAESFRNDRVKKIISMQDDEVINSLKKIVNQAIKSGQINSTHNPEMLTYLLIAIINGLEDRILQHPKIKLNSLFKQFDYCLRNLLINKT